MLTMNVLKFLQAPWLDSLPHGLVKGANDFMEGNIIELAGPLLGVFFLIILVLGVSIVQLKRQEI
ncbi:hypothetical protein ACIQD3_07375 [Peribacillus loiseleuriae]|uniref:hypothetical protein n=1 Tax=Peribacillus loiseleuriae TaxID=1679170 RepID=UPI00380E5946